MNYLTFLFLIISNPFYAKNLPGEWIGESGFLESPVLTGNVFANPATADTISYFSITSHLYLDDYEDLEGNVSSVTLTLPAPRGFSLGGRINQLYNSRLEGKVSLSNEWDSFEEYYERRGGLDQYSFFIKKSFGSLSLGIDANLLNGEIEDRWKIDFEEYNDVFDTLSTYFRGYSAGLGLLYHWSEFKVGGYFNFYQKLEYWENGEDRSAFTLKRPIRFGIEYSPDKGKSVMVSADRKAAVLMGRYGPIMIGYGRIYGSGYDLDIEGNRFIAGISFSLNKMPLKVAFEDRRYSGEFSDNQFMGTITFSISGREGGKQ